MAKEKMFNENINIAYKIVQRYRNCGIEYEDLKQIALLGLWKAVNTYKADKKVLFSSYSYKVIQNEINLYLKTNKKHFLNRYLKDEIIEGFTIEEVIPNKDNQIERLEDFLDTRKYISKIKKYITNKREKIIVDMLLSSKKQNEIAKELGISRQRVSKIIENIRKRIKKMEELK